MKRMVRRTLAVLTGLYLGWVAAGLMGPTADNLVYGDSSQPAVHDEHGHEADAGMQAALQLAVTPEDVPWLGNVVFGVAVLFGAAATVGYAALKLRGPELPDPADDHH